MKLKTSDIQLIGYDVITYHASVYVATDAEMLLSYLPYYVLMLHEYNGLAQSRYF